MNLRLVCKLLSLVALLIGGTMAFSLPWAVPALGHRTDPHVARAAAYEYQGVLALVGSIAFSLAVGGVLWRIGRTSNGQLFRKEAMAAVGLSWVLATVLGAMPFYFARTYRAPAVRLFSVDQQPQIHGKKQQELLTADEYRIVDVLLQHETGAKGLSEAALIDRTELPRAPHILHQLAEKSSVWRRTLIFPEYGQGPADRRNNYRIRWIRMGLVDSLFESQSGFSTTGATVISNLEDPVLVPHCILFWRSSTHFLGGLGIIVLFVAILGQGSAGKALMRAEMPGPTKEGSLTRMQHTAWLFAAIYCGLTGLLTVILWLLGMSVFDALCHAFGTMATGGFSTYDASLGHFQQVAAVSSVAIESTVILFMILAGTNFTLLYFLLLRRPGLLLADVEWRTYMAIILGVTALVVLFGLANHDFQDPGQPEQSWVQLFPRALRYGLFQVVSILTTTGYGTHNFDRWNSFGRGVLFLLMFVGGCAGSTGGGLKVIRHILFHKILWLELEQSFHPSVVRPLRLGGKTVEDSNLRHSILVYFGLILAIFVLTWMLLVTIEPNSTWGVSSINHKLIDSASAISATLNNIGPGLGTIGATQSYTHFSWYSKLLFTVLMMIGRLEIFVIAVLFVPGFWRMR